MTPRNTQLLEQFKQHLRTKPAEHQRTIPSETTIHIYCEDATQLLNYLTAHQIPLQFLDSSKVAAFLSEKKYTEDTVSRKAASIARFAHFLGENSIPLQIERASIIKNASFWPSELIRPITQQGFTQITDEARTYYAKTRIFPDILRHYEESRELLVMSAMFRSGINISQLVSALDKDCEILPEEVTISVNRKGYNFPTTGLPEISPYKQLRGELQKHYGSRSPNLLLNKHASSIGGRSLRRQLEIISGQSGIATALRKGHREHYQE